MRYTWIPRACATCDGDGTLVDGHSNDPYAEEVECEYCGGTGYVYGQCGDCDAFAILADGCDVCSRCDYATWQEVAEDHRQDAEREREMYEG